MLNYFYYSCIHMCVHIPHNHNEPIPDKKEEIQRKKSIEIRMEMELKMDTEVVMEIKMR